MFSSYVYLLMELSDHKHEIVIFMCCKIPPNFRMSRVMMPFRLPETNLQKTPTTGLEGISGCFSQHEVWKIKRIFKYQLQAGKIHIYIPPIENFQTIILCIYMSCFFFRWGVCTKSPEITKHQLPYEFNLRLVRSSWMWKWLVWIHVVDLVRLARKPGGVSATWVAMVAMVLRGCGSHP